MSPKVMKSFDAVQEEHGVMSPDLDGPWFGLPIEPEVQPDSVATSMRFRTQLRINSLTDAPAVVYLCADSRYRLSINGELVAAGPAKPTGKTWFVDAVDVSAHLCPGVNTIGIDVLSYTTSAPGNASVPRTGRPGLLVRGTIGDTDLSQPAAWKCQPVTG